MVVREYASVSVKHNRNIATRNADAGLGQNFALTEASYTMIRLLQHFKRIEPRDDKGWSEFQTLTLAVGGNGVKVGLYEN